MHLKNSRLQNKTIKQADPGQTHDILDTAIELIHYQVFAGQKVSHMGWTLGNNLLRSAGAVGGSVS